MFHDTWIRRLSWLGSVVLVMFSGAMLRAQEVFKAGEIVVAEQPSGYWLGVVCDEADAALRSQLKLEDAGLVVRKVVPDTPAAKAGIEEHDVILGIGEAAIGSVDQLVEEVNQSEGKELAVQVLRQGERRKIKIVPVKRPAGGPWRNLPPDVRLWLDRQGIQGPGGPWRLKTVRPGVITRRVVRRKLDLPEGMSVSITKTGKEPAKIVVQQGEKKWEATEDKLDDLPAEARKYVAPLVHGGAAFVPGGDVDVEVKDWPSIFGGPPKRLERQVEELNKQMQQLRRAIEEMSKGKKE